MRHVAIAVITLLLVCPTLCAQNEYAAAMPAYDSTAVIQYKYTPIDPSEYAPQPAAEKKREGLLHRIVRYFEESSIDRTFEKKFDFTFIAGPYYSNSLSFGIGALASGLYRIDRTDSIAPPSDVSLYANASITGYYMVGVSGNNIFTGNRNRIDYDMWFQSQPTYFWGLGYRAARDNPRSRYVAKQYDFKVRYLHRLFEDTYGGAFVEFDYMRGIKFTRKDYLDGQRDHYAATTIGLLLQYDTRDFIPNPSHGVYVCVQEAVRPKGMGTCGHTLWHTDVTIDGYVPLWRGGVLAMDLYAEFNSAGTPWTLYARMGGSRRMRGFYEGRFADQNMVTLQVELRQRIWRRIGCTVWGGAGNVFRRTDDFRWNHTLPNYGVGLRWEFKHRVNIRIDCGFGPKINGKLVNGLLFSINEAF